nr:hypothetical protein [Tanacetum cinerariifolium]
MSNTNNTMQIQTSNTLHNAIMEAGGKDRPPMLAPDKVVLVSEGSSETTTERHMENYKNVSQDIRDQLNAKAEVVQIILTGIDNYIYSTVDVFPNACEMWKAIERLKQEWQRFVTLVKKSQELKTLSYHKLYDILKQHQNRVNELRAEILARTANPLALVSLQQPVYHPQNHPSHYTQNSSTRSQQAATRNRGKEIANSLSPIYDQEPSMVDEDDEMSKDNEIDKLMALISLSFKKIYKPTNNNLRTSSNTNRANQDNSPRINRGTGFDNQRIGNVAGARETVEQADWRDYTDDESEDQELEAHYMYMAQIQEVTLDADDDSGPIFDSEPLKKVSNNDNYNVFAIENEHPKQSKSIHDTYLIEQDEHNVIIDSLDMSYDREQLDQDDDDDLANERELLASLIEKLKCEIDDSKNRNKFLETSNKVLVDKLKGEIKDFKTKNKSLKSSNNRFKEANNKMSAKNELMYNDLKKFQAELDRQIKKELFVHQETISILSQAKEAQIKFYKTHEDKELDKVIALENKVKVLDNIVYKTGQTVQTMNMLNRNCKTSFSKPEFLKKAQRENPRLYDIEKRVDESILYDRKCKSSKELFKIKRSVATIFDGVECRKQTIAKRTYFDHIDPFIQNTIEANFFLEIRIINVDLEKFHVCLKEEMVADLRYFNSLELEVDSLKSQLKTQKTWFSNEIDRLSREYYYVDHMNVILGVYTELDEVTNLQCDYLKTLEKYECLEKELSKSKMMSKSFEALPKHAINLEIDLQQCQEKIKNDKSFKENQSKEFRKEREHKFEIQDLKAQLQDKGIAISELKKLIEKLKGKYVDTKFEKSSVIRQPNSFKSQRPSILGKPTIFSYSLERKDFSKSKSVTKNNVSNDFSKPVTAQILPPNKKSILKNTNVLALGMYKLHTTPTQTRTTQLPYDFRKTNKRVSFSTRVIPATSVSRPQLKSNQIEDRVMLNNSQRKKQEVEDQRRNVKFFKNKTSVTACNDSLNARTSDVNFICATCGKCVLNVKHDMCVLHSLNGVNSRTKIPMVVLVSSRDPKRIVNQSVAKPHRKIVASESTNQKPRYTNRKLYENVFHCVKNYIVLYSFAARRDDPIHRRLWVLKAHDGKCSRGTGLYSITLQDTSSPNPICLMAKATSSQAWLWHRHLSHLNFDTINLLSKNDIVIGLPKLKFVKDHLCSSCELGKSKQKYTWTHFLRSKDKTPEVLIDFLRLVQRGLHAQAEAIATTCFTQNRSLVIPRQEKTPYHIINNQKPSIKFFHIFGSLCYIVRDGENLDKIKEKGDACIFVGYSTQLRAYRVFNKRTRVIVETIHVNFDELPQMASDHVSSDPVPQCQRTALEHDNLSPGPQFVSKSSAETTADAPNQCQQQNTTPLNNQTTPEPTCQVPTQAPTVTSTENINQAETISENAQVEDDEFINIFCTPVQDRGETSSRHVDLSNMHTFYQRHPFKHRWTKDHPLEQVTGNPSQSVRTRRQLESTREEELHQFDRLDVWELVDRPLCKNIINMKWLWKNKRDKENTVIRNKSCLVAKGYDQKEGVDFKNHLHQLLDWKFVGTPMATKHLDADLSGTPVDQMKYQNHAGCLDSRKSTSGGIQFLGGDKLVSRSSKMQDCTSMSLAEAEYVSLSTCCAQVLCMRTQLTDYGLHFDKIPMYCDSKADTPGMLDWIARDIYGCL